MSQQVTPASRPPADTPRADATASSEGAAHPPSVGANSPIVPVPPPRLPSVGWASAGAGGAMATGMAAYELLKQAAFPGISLWQSHALTIVVAGVAATVATARTLVLYRRVARRVDVESTERRRAQAAVDALLLEVVERERAELALRASEERYRLLVERSPEAIALYHEGRLLYVNPRAVALLGATDAGELVGKDLGDFLSVDDVPRWRDRLAAHGRGDAPVAPEEYVVSRLDGRSVTIETTSVEVDYGGTPAVQVMAHDITLARAATEALRASEERLRFALEAARMTVWTRKRETYAASLARRAARPTPDALTEDSIATLLERVHDDDRGRVIESWDHAVCAGGAFALEFRTHAPDGAIVWRAETGRSLDERSRAAADGSRVIAGVSADVTAHRKLEEQFRQAQKMEAVGRIAGGVAHDFNNLLTVIGSFAELAGLTIDDSHPARCDLREISNAARRGAELTQQLLAFSRRQPLTPCVLDINTVVADAERMLRRLVPPAVTFHARLCTEALTAHADEGALQQVLMNLIVNAVDAMPTGGELVVSTERRQLTDVIGTDELPAGDYVALSVTDSGVGIDDATRARLFEPFFTTKTVGKGTGLGLATVFGIVHQAGGVVRVESSPGHGAQFTVLLPMAAGQPLARIRTPSRSTVRRRPAARVRVLLVDDDAPVRAATQRLLGNHGYDVVTAENGADAMTAFVHAVQAGQPIDVVVTDVVMPVMGGRELAARLAHEHPGIPTVFISGYEGDAEVGGDGRDGVLRPMVRKPFTSGDLVAAVDAAGERHARRAPA